MKLGVAQRRIRLPHQHRFVKLAAAQMAAKLAHPREMEAKQLLVRDSPLEPALAVGDEAVHRNAHRVDQQGSRPYPSGERLGNGVAYGWPRPAASMPGPTQEEAPSKSCSRVSQIATSTTRAGTPTDPVRPTLRACLLDVQG